MEAVTCFSLAAHTGPYEQWPAQTPLLRDGAATCTRVRGYVMAAQYRCAAGFLLVTSFDCPFEESNAFTLLDGQLNVIARRSLGVPYGSFLLQAHWPVDAATLALQYDEDLFYRLHILPPRRFIGRRPRLSLRRCQDWSSDERMREAAEALRRRLARTKAAMDADPDR